MQCVLMDIQNGCHLAILNKINVKIWWVVSITLIHKPTRYCESHLKTMCVILFTDIKTDTSDYITSMSEVTKILYYLLTIYVIVGIKLLSVVYCFLSVSTKYCCSRHICTLVYTVGNATRAPENPGKPADFQTRKPGFVCVQKPRFFGFDENT